ncbi:MAG: chromosome segregation protein SMC [Gammaproteobacteria bacterium]|nr:chromosome segregation protein SMC [Gammaproteobacteria bacterium]
MQDAQRLGEAIEVDEEWERAVETVLGFHLEAVGVERLGDLPAALDELEQGALGLIDRSARVSQAPGRAIGAPLTDKVRCEWQLDSLFAGISTAQSLQEALDLRPRLAAHESVITPEGVWIGPNWLRAARDADEKAGVLHREHEIRALSAELEELNTSVEALQQQLDAGRERLDDLERERRELRARLDSAQADRGEIQAGLSAKTTALEQARARSERIRHETAEVRRQMETQSRALDEAHARLRAAESQVGDVEQARARLLERREDLRGKLEAAREQARGDHDTAHQHALRVEAVRTQLESTREGMGRVETQIEQLRERRDEITRALGDSARPVEELETELEQALAQRLDVEGRLNECRTRVQDIEHAMRASSEQSAAVESRAQEIRNELEQLRMNFQGVTVRLQTLQEQIDETGFDLQQLYAELPEDAEESAWAEELERIENRIQRLGSINMAAIDEFEEQSERKKYLDAQFEDLTEALTTLENAIRKIDRETRTRFKETFDKVNDGLKKMFPRLFGGGHAYLELTGEDLLSAGVTVMARPPGKRISTIHLLSGGEKALTAVALVFSLFELNPAPFCLLDEVDAPLDDANVGRFCDLVREMSERIQFIVITHNKLTMEMTGHLTGVTMNEPGVSRLVAVDVEEAAAMAAG